MCLAPQCPAKHKLPALYLVDSIAKNVGQPFVSLFAQNLPQARLPEATPLPAQCGSHKGSDRYPSDP